MIRVHGARVNNLKDVSVEIPKRRLTAERPQGYRSAASQATREDRRRATPKTVREHTA